MSKSTVLFVDDEVQVLSSLRRELLDSEYRCIFVSSAAEALDVLDSQIIDVIVTDMKMPKMNGLELLKIVKERFPLVVRVILSGYTHLPQVMAAINKGNIFKFIPKPWDFDKDIKPAIEESLDYRDYMMNLYSINTQQVNLDGFREEVERFKEIAKSMQLTLKQLLQQELSDDAKENVTNIFNLYQDIYFEYMNTLPHNATSFIIEYLDEKINNHFKNSNQDSSYLKIELKNDEEATYYGNVNLISFVTTTFLENLAKYSQDNIMPMVNVESGKKVDNMSIFLSFTLKRGVKFDLMNKTKKKELDTLHLILEQIIKLVDGSLVISVIQNNVFAKLDVPLLKQV